MTSNWWTFPCEYQHFALFSTMMGRGKIDLFWKKVFSTTKDNNYDCVHMNCSSWHSVSCVETSCRRDGIQIITSAEKSLQQQIPVLINKLCTGDNDIMLYVGGAIAGKHKKMSMTFIDKLPYIACSLFYALTVTYVILISVNLSDNAFDIYCCYISSISQKQVW